MEKMRDYNNITMQPKFFLENQIGVFLQKLGLKLILAESCTGGLISHRITNIPGSSDYFLGCHVAYSYEAKETWLGVRHATLSQFGAVSRETVIEMACGARSSLQNYFSLEKVIGISVSGIAGPGGGTPDKPVGTVWVGLSAARQESAWQFFWKGNREENKAQSAQAALQILLDYLKTL
jgi:PncC family amidohydrolase